MDASNSNECESTEYTNCSHIKVFEVLQSLRKNNVPCDIKLETNDGTAIFAHKVVLMSASQHFLASFTNCSESEKYVVTMSGLDPTVLQLLVDFIYTGKIMISKKNVKDLLPAAKYLQLDFVKSSCIKFLQTQLDPQNCIEIRAFADVLNCSELLSSSEVYIKKKFLDVVKCNDFLLLSSEKVIELISSNFLNASEEKVYECVINWIKHKLDDRYDSLPKLMEHVRLPLASLDYLSNNVVVEPLIKNSPQCKDYIIEAFQLHALKTQQLITIPQTIRNTPRKSGQKVILAYRYDYENELSSIYWYDPTTSFWTILTEMSLNNNFCSGLALMKNNFVFLMCHRSRIFMIDFSLQSSSFVTLNDMVVVRGYYGFGVLGDHLYVVGGVSFGSEVCLKSAEVYDMNNQRWTMISNMATERYDMGVVVLNDLLYVVGGFNNQVNYLKSVECYDPILNQWTSVAEMSVCRSKVGVGVMNGLIYAVGGMNASGSLKSVEVYQPSSGVWTYIADMHFPRGLVQPSVLTLDGLLYVLYGLEDLPGNWLDSIMDRMLDSIEIYNPNTNTWSVEILPELINQYGLSGLIVDTTVVTKFYNYLSREYIMDHTQ